MSFKGYNPSTGDCTLYVLHVFSFYSYIVMKLLESLESGPSLLFLMLVLVEDSGEGVFLAAGAGGLGVFSS